MKPFVVICRAMAIAAVLLWSALPAGAARHGGTTLDDIGHPRAPQAAPTAAPTPAAPAHDDDPCLRPCPPAASATATLHEPCRGTRSLPAMPRDHRTEKRERGRTTPAGAAQLHRPTAQRSKGTVRNTPATPGMGLLLRFSTDAGREISFNDARFSPNASSMRSGRAPPRAGPSPNSAPASLPRPHHLAITSRAPRPLPPGAPPIEPDDPREPSPRAPGSAAAPTACVLAIPTAVHGPAPLPSTGSRAIRVKGRTACILTPFGGCDT